MLVGSTPDRPVICRGGRIMSRRLSWIALFATALLFLATMPAAAVGPFAPAEQVIGGCTAAFGDAAIATDGTTRGFANCTGPHRSGPIRFFRDAPGSAPVQERTPYTGVVHAVAWDGQDSAYVVLQRGTGLFIGKRVESSGAYSPLTTLTTSGGAGGGRQFEPDVVASNGRWWAVWGEQVGPGGADAQTELFQRHTLLGVQGRTRITTTAANIGDGAPTLAYANGRMTMVWTRTTDPLAGGPADLRIAQSTGGAWLSRPFAFLGDQNEEPDVTIYAGVTWVTWTRDQRIVVANNSDGLFDSRTFAAAGNRPTVAVSGSHAFVTWFATGADRIAIAELSGGVWTSGQVAGARSLALRVLAQGTRARVVYWAQNVGTGFAALYIRTQT
jgi:hypothetical protein